MKKPKGFTLIELLAVIVILSIIALITIPLILGVIERTQKSAYEASLRSVFSATEIYIASGEFRDFPEEGINITDTGIQLKNKDFISGKIVKNSDGEIELNKVTNGTYCGSGTLDNLIVTEGSCDDEIPLITVSPITMNIQLDSEYIDIGVSAVDNIDGDISSNIVITGSVNTSTLGTYTLTYNVSDSSGNEANSVTRTVNVIPALAIVTTDTTPSDITSNNATISGEVTDEGGGIVTERGIVYGTSSNPVTTGTKIVVPGTTGTFSGNLTGLTKDTIYYARTYATNSTGTSYGNEITFTTLYGGIDEYTTLMLHMDGTENGTTFTDETGKSVTRYGSTVTKTGVKKFGNSSVYLDGASYLTVPNHTDFAMGTGDWTIDFWIRLDNYGYWGVIGPWDGTTHSNRAWFIASNSEGNLSLYVNYDTSGNYSYITNSIILSPGTFHHVAAGRHGNEIFIAIDGNYESTVPGTPITPISTTLPVYIGQFGNGYNMTGYLDEVRVSKGMARWTANFTPPTMPYTE